MRCLYNLQCDKPYIRQIIHRRCICSNSDEIVNHLDDAVKSTASPLKFVFRCPSESPNICLNHQPRVNVIQRCQRRQTCVQVAKNASRSANVHQHRQTCVEVLQNHNNCTFGLIISKMSSCVAPWAVFHLLSPWTCTQTSEHEPHHSTTKHAYERSLKWAPFKIKNGKCSKHPTDDDMHTSTWLHPYVHKCMRSKPVTTQPATEHNGRMT
jgi:hypothetical protein